MAVIHKSISFGLALGLVLCAGIGCGVDPALAGKWEGTRDWKRLGLEDDRIAIEISRLKITLEESGKFVMNDSGVPYQGRWSRKGEDIPLVIDIVMNRKLDRQSMAVQDLANSMRLEVGKNGELTYFDAGQSSNGVILTRVSKP